MTIQSLYKDAILVQDASNLSGVLHGWHRAICEARRLEVNDTILKHLNALWGAKVASLCRMTFTAIGGAEDDTDVFREAYAEATSLNTEHTQKGGTLR